MKCKFCGSLEFKFLKTSSEPEGIRYDKVCKTCGTVFASHKWGIRPLNLPEKKQDNYIPKAKEIKNFTNGKPWVVTEEDCKKSWSGGYNGKYFRCGLCGYKFQSGDIARWQYTNNIPGASGNPMICEQCDDDPSIVIEKWKKLCSEFDQEKFWFFKKGYE